MIDFLSSILDFFHGLTALQLVTGISIGGFLAWTFAIPLIYNAIVKKR